MITPSDIDKAIKIDNRGPLTAKELEQIGMSISALGLVTAGVVYKLPTGDGEVADGDNDFEGRAREIENATSRREFTAPGSLEALSRKSSEPVSLPDIRRRSKRVPGVRGGGEGDDGDESDDERAGKRRRHCGCLSDGPATWAERVGRRGFVAETVALNLLDGMLEKSQVCFKHLKDMGGKLGLRVKTLKTEELRERLQHIQDNRSRIGDLKAANDTVKWFRRRSRPPHPADALGTYKYIPVDPSARFDYDQAALREWIGGINVEGWERDGSVNIDLFGWW